MPQSDPSLSEEDKLALVRDGYDAIAEQYTDTAARTDDTSRQDQLRILLSHLPPGSRILELGCGGGVPVAATVVGEGHLVVGVDVSPRQIDLARRNVPKGDFTVGNATDQDYESGSFDAVVMLYAITHVPRERWQSLFENVVRWLQTHGWLLLNVPQHDDPGFLEEDFLRMGSTNWTNCFGAEKTERMMAEAGLDVVGSTLLPDDLGANAWVWILARRS